MRARRPRGVRLAAWEQPLEAWDEPHRVGLRSACVVSVLAAPSMVEQRGGPIADVPSMGAVSDLHSVAYGTAEAGLDELALEYGFTDVDGRQPRVIRSHEDAAKALSSLLDAQRQPAAGRAAGRSRARPSGRAGW